MVVTSRLAARKAGSRQLCTGFPSSQTVQAPQSPASQPFLTPSAPCSRSHVRKHWPGRGSVLTGRPSIMQGALLNVSFMRRTFEFGANFRGEMMGEVALVGGGPVHVTEPASLGDGGDRGIQ